GVDWRTPLDVARRRIGRPVTLQGNLDPAVCLSPIPAVEEEVRAILALNAGHPGHVFNLGHGVLPETDPGVLAHVVELVHAEGRADGPGDDPSPGGATAGDERRARRTARHRGAGRSRRAPRTLDGALPSPRRRPRPGRRP